jgi:osmotically-inducible protein OsmY
MKKTLLAMIALLTLITGCIPLAIGGAALVGTNAAHSPGLGGGAADERIKTDISYKWLANKSSLFRNLRTKVYDRRVLVLGTVATQASKAEAIRLVSAVAGVRAVYDEILIGEDQSYGADFSDLAIDKELETKLLFKGGVKDLNFSTEVQSGVVYLLGSARSQVELQKAIDVARNIGGVKQVVSYIEVVQ